MATGSDECPFPEEDRKSWTDRQNDAMTPSGHWVAVDLLLFLTRRARLGVFSGGSMGRREFIGLIGGAVAWPIKARAQQSRPMRRVGFLRVGPPPPAFIDGFRQGMRERGLIEGQHFVIEYGLAKSAAQIPDVATELVTRRLDVLVASGTPSVLPARDAAGRTPVVFVATIDPVAAGLVTSLARHDQNITGMTSISGDVIAKRLQMIKEVVPTLSRVALLVRESSPDTAQYVRESQTAARKLGVKLQIEIERNPSDLEGIFGRGARRERPRGGR